MISEELSFFIFLNVKKPSLDDLVAKILRSMVLINQCTNEDKMGLNQLNEAVDENF